MAVLAIGAFTALRAYNWIQAGETWKAVLLGMAFMVGLAAAGYIKARFFKKPRAYPPALIAEKVSRIAFDADLQITLILPSAAGEQRAMAVLQRIAAAYRHYNNPAAASFVLGQIQPVLSLDASLAPTPPRCFGARSVIGVREAAVLWHPPAPGDDAPSVERSGSRSLVPTPSAVSEGALVGDTTQVRPREIRFPDDLLRRHHLYVARTRMGKSTLMHHIITHRLREKAAGRDHDAIVVIDPHADLVAGILQHVPAELIPHVRLIDLADTTGSVGITSSIPTSSPTATAPPIPWSASPGVSGSSGDHACSPSSNTWSRASMRPTLTPLPIPPPNTPSSTDSP